ncbi:hypothetical protein CHUAL_012340 [Chamberlinius hualienensis]
MDNITLMAKLSDRDIEILHPFFESFHKDVDDFHKPHLRESVMYVYPLFIFLYALITVIGIVGGISVIVTIVRHRLYHDQTHYFICNLALSDILKCLLVLPVTLANLLIKNWMFGSFLCFFIPMIQYIPIIASTLTFLLIAVDRYLLMFPMTSRAPRFICVLGVWVLSVCVVLPFALYIKYYALELYLGSQFDGVGICAVNVEDDIEEYARGLFIALYVLPLTIIAFLHVRMSGEMKSRELPLSSVIFEMSSTDERSVATTRSGSETPCPARNIWASENDTKPDELNASNSTLDIGKPVNTRNNNTLEMAHVSLTNTVIEADDDVFDLRKEKRTQKYLITMVTLYGMCLCPFEILRLVRHIIVETNDNSGHLDLAFLIFVWIGFLPVCITPVLFASWQMSRPVKDRLRGYFRFSNRRRSRPSADNLNSIHHHNRSHTKPNQQKHKQHTGSNNIDNHKNYQGHTGGHSNMGFQANAGSDGSNHINDLG